MISYFYIPFKIMAQGINNFANLPNTLKGKFFNSFNSFLPIDSRTIATMHHDLNTNSYYYECERIKISANYRNLNGYIPDYATYTIETFIPRHPWRRGMLLRTDFDNPEDNYVSTARSLYYQEFLARDNYEMERWATYTLPHGCHIVGFVEDPVENRNDNNVIVEEFQPIVNEENIVEENNNINLMDFENTPDDEFLQ